MAKDRKDEGAGADLGAVAQRIDKARKPEARHELRQFRQKRRDKDAQRKVRGNRDELPVEAENIEAAEKEAQRQGTREIS